MTAPTEPTFSFPVRSRLSTLRGVALVLATAALISGFVAQVARGPTAAQIRAAATGIVVRCIEVPAASRGRT
jgi:hypothetical protein